MLDQIHLENILFLDAETVPAYPSFNDVPEPVKKLWEKKSEWLKKNEEDTPETLYHRAGIYAEFGKLVCISVGFFSGEEFRLKSFFGEDEGKVLTGFRELLLRHFPPASKFLCAHNGKEFDYPFIARRMLINGIRIPPILDTQGKKPWEVSHLDTMDLWRFGDYKNYTSLELLANIFNIPTPKDDMDGSDVHRVYWVENDLDRIVTYCQKDVVTIARLMQCYKGLPIVADEKIRITNEP